MALAVILFVVAACLGDVPARGRLFAAAGVLTGVGGGVVVGLWVYSHAQVQAAQRELILRAERLRMERARARREEPRPRPAAAPVPVTAKAVAAAVTEVLATPPRATRATEGAGLCPVCQTKVLAGEELIRCPRCNAPYHSDCWQYNGGCGVYACPVRVVS